MNRFNCNINKLSFIHIPKTAGLSLHAELVGYFGVENTIRIGSQEERALFFFMESEQLKNYAYIAGHISVKELSQKGIHYPTISVLREPVRRLVSLQHYLTNSDHKEHQGLNFNNIDQLLQEMFLKKTFNLQCWHLCGRPSFELALQSIRNNNLFVVPLEYYQDLLDTLSDLLGITLCNQCINVTQYKTPVDIDGLKNELLDLIIGDDKKLFSYVMQNYESLKQAFIQSLAL
jgi:hypothetical protein